MGFYLELHRRSEAEFEEGPPPPVFWTLYVILGFALACMGGAAFGVLRDLAAKGSALDQMFIYLYLATIPFYLALGVKLAWVRKYVRWDERGLETGFRLGRKKLFARRYPRRGIVSVEAVNVSPSPNRAPHEHDDPQYYVQGHWRVVAETASGKKIVIDRHTERGALEDLTWSLSRWIASPA